ncbi:DNA translocase FtsK 4TM domain-containing protein, partial [Pontibaca methylaminivorans]|uniref:DNA translocase FtsK 4TM domain-containing protein n=1 Tax=Pontibaca methylaminivorans TaxID=515897 RepID=UPI002FDADBA1
MAYHSRSRDPFLDAGMQEAIEKRGRELLGLLLLGLGLAVAAMIGSYTPEDPNWLVSTDAPVQNWLGRTGASIAAPLIMVVGRGAWMIALVLVIWGGRLALHRGAESAFGRVVFAPIVIALASIYCASLVPGSAWQASHSYGLGGLFGDTVTGALLTFLPLNSHVAIKLLSLASALATFGVGAFVLGFDRSALLRAGRIALFGIIMCYGALMTLLERGAANGIGNLRERRERMAQRREENRAAQAEAQLDDEIRFEP